MTKEFECGGIWWAAENPESKISGKLIFRKGKRLELQLTGHPEDLEAFSKSASVILGNTSKGRITLHGSFFVIQEFMSSFGLSSRSLYVDKAFVGEHFQRAEDIKFSNLIVQYSYLNEWLGIHGFYPAPSEDFDVVIKYKRPDSIKAVVGDYEINIIFGFETSYSIMEPEVNFKQKAFIEIKPLKNSLLSFDEYQEIMQSIQNFLSFALSKPVYPLDVKGRIDESEKRMVEIYCDLCNIEQPFKKLPHSVKMFSFRGIAGRFEKILNLWFEKYETLKPVYDLYLGALYNPQMYLENEFLSMVQALEAYHRRKFDGKYLSDDDYSEVYIKLKSAIDNLAVEKSFKESLKAKLKYGNEYSLRKRLKDLLSKFRDITKEFIANEDDFIGKVVTTRNRLTHLDKDLEDAAGSEFLFEMTQKLKVILQICILRELEFSKDEIKNVVRKDI